MREQDYRQRLVERIRSAGAECRTTRIPELPVRGHALAVAESSPTSQVADFVRKAATREELDLRLTSSFGLRAVLLDGVDRRMVRLEWRSGVMATALGEGVIANRADSERRVGVDVDLGASSLVLTDEAGRICVVTIHSGGAEEMFLDEPALPKLTSPEPLPAPPWAEWAAGLDEVLAAELKALSGQATDLSALAAAGALLVHDHAFGVSSDAERVALALQGRRRPRRCDGWLGSLEEAALGSIEFDAIALTRVLASDLTQGNEHLGWRNPGDVPVALRLERDRLELVREALRERGLGDELAAALSTLDEQITAAFEGDDPGDAADRERFIMAAAFRDLGWWTASGGRLLELDEEALDLEDELER